VRGRALTLKVKRRQAGAPEPAKFMGHGICDNASRSVTLGRCFSGADEMAEQAAALLAAMQIPPEELRGLGITVGGVCGVGVEVGGAAWYKGISAEPRGTGMV
jgi:DNA repair protein REV1